MGAHGELRVCSAEKCRQGNEDREGQGREEPSNNVISGDIKTCSDSGQIWSIIHTGEWFQPEARGLGFMTPGSVSH